MASVSQLCPTSALNLSRHGVWRGPDRETPFHWAAGEAGKEGSASRSPSLPCSQTCSRLSDTHS